MGVASTRPFLVRRFCATVRIWDVPPASLCRQHLLGEHRELHGLWNVLTQGKKGYSKHPETLRWVGKTKALWNRHELLAAEMQARGYNHLSPLDAKLADGPETNSERVDSEQRQWELLIAKPCECPRD